MDDGAPGRPRLPEWLKVRPPGGDDYHDVKRLLRRSRLHTICESGACPNRGECFSSRTATFLILGDVCTRSCRFCNVATGRPGPVDPDEPRRLAEAVRALRLRFAVVTSVDRDDLPDGGAAAFAATIREIRRLVPECGIEVLTPDFGGDGEAAETVLAAGPDVMAHNLETVPRLYRSARPASEYARSLALLARVRRWADAHANRQADTHAGRRDDTQSNRRDDAAASGRASAAARMRVKTGIMVGLGETPEEVAALMADCAAAGVDILTIGQYLQPTLRHHPVARFWAPDEFRELARVGREAGIGWVEAGPLVRSSYHAREQAEELGLG